MVKPIFTWCYYTYNERWLPYVKISNFFLDKSGYTSIQLIYYYIYIFIIIYISNMVYTIKKTHIIINYINGRYNRLILYNLLLLLLLH